MQEFSKEKSVVVDLNTLGKEIVDYHVGKNVLKKISNSCRKLVEYNFYYEEAGSKIYFNLFDNIVIINSTSFGYIKGILIVSYVPPCLYFLF